MKPLGQHYLLECDGVEPSLLANPQQLEQILCQAAQQAQAHIVFAHLHHFGEGQGVTGVLVLQESHITIHTWPEYAYAALDVFMCGQAQPQLAVAYLIEQLQPQQHRWQMIERQSFALSSLAPLGRGQG